MEVGVIDNFVNYKISFLIKCGLTFFYNDKDLDLVEKFLEKYLKNYVYFKFYNEVHTLKSSTDFSLDSLKKELEGMEIELLDDYSINELIDSNEEYNYRIKLIHKAKEVSYFVSKLDNIGLISPENVEEEITNFINSNSKIHTYIGDNKAKIISLYKKYLTRIRNFFKTTDEFYKLTYRNISEDNNLVLVELKEQIKVINSNYKKSIIQRVYNNNRLDNKKALVLVQKLSKEILRKFINNEKNDNYLIKLSEKLFVKNKLVIENITNNPLFKKNVTFIVDYNTYTLRKKFLNNDKYKLACIQDCSHLIDFKDKLNIIDDEGVFSYIIVNDYKNKEKEEIHNYVCNNGLKLIVDKEV